MILNKKYRILAWFLSLAFVLPIVIKTQHMMFPNHEHHGHTCSHRATDLQDICEIQEFDYFFFAPADITSIPAIAAFEFQTHRVEPVKKSYKESELSYSLRAPPSNAS